MTRKSQNILNSASFQLMRKIQWTDCKSNGNELFKMGEAKLARQQAEAKQKKKHTSPFKLTVRLTPTCTQGYGTTHQKAWTYINAERAVPPCLHVSVTYTFTVVYPIFTRVTTLLANVIGSPIVPPCLREAMTHCLHCLYLHLHTRL